MFVKLYVSFVLFAACAQYVELKKSYSQLSTNPVGSCITLDYDLTAPNPIRCDRSWIANGTEAKSDDFYLYFLLGDISTVRLFAVVDESGTQDGRMVEIRVYQGVTKLTLTDSAGKTALVACGTDTREATEEDQNILKDKCDEKDLKVVDQTQCP